jgi:hypothetical protein
VTPIDEPEHRQESLGSGSGDIELEAAISRLRASMLHVVNELDRFTTTVKQARIRVEDLVHAAEREAEDDK